jgi:hypothetical protein
MAAGEGFKTFISGDVLTAADVNGYLMQGVLVFANATNRDAEITSPQEGQFAYLKDTNVTTYYTGSAWANLDTTGMTNPMTTTGDTIYSSSGSTPARLGIGTAGQVLQVNSGATAPEWATPAGGGLTLLSTTTLSGATTTISGISGSYVNLLAIVFNATNDTAAGDFRCAPNGSTNITDQIYNTTNTAINLSSAAYLRLSNNDAVTHTNPANSWAFTIFNYASTTGRKPFQISGSYHGASIQRAMFGSGDIDTTSAITSLVFSNSGGNHSAGTVLLYGVK